MKPRWQKQGITATVILWSDGDRSAHKLKIASCDNDHWKTEKWFSRDICNKSLLYAVCFTCIFYERKQPSTLNMLLKAMIEILHPWQNEINRVIGTGALCIRCNLFRILQILSKKKKKKKTYICSNVLYFFPHCNCYGTSY